MSKSVQREQEKGGENLKNFLHGEIVTEKGSFFLNETDNEETTEEQE